MHGPPLDGRQKLSGQGYNAALGRLAIGVGLFTAIASAALAVICQRYYYADTPFFLFQQLETGGFFSNDPQRQWAQLALQLPLQAALAAGLDDLGVLGGIYGATLYGLPLLLLLACYHYSENKALFLFPLASYLLASLPAASFIISEAHLAAGLFWLSAVLINRTRDPGAAQWLLLLCLALLAGRSYESAALLLPLLLLMLAMRGRLQLTTAAVPWWLLAGILLVGTGMSTLGILEPRDTVNKGRFLQGLGQILGSSNYVWAAGAAVLVLALLQAYWSRLAVRTVALACALLTLALLYLFALRPGLLNLELAYPSRVLLLPVPGLLFGLYLLTPALSDPRRLRLLQGLAALCLFCAGYQFAAQAHTSYQWHGYRSVFHRTLHDAGPRVIEFRETALGQEKEGRILLAAQHWRWTLPLLNIAFAGGARVPRYLYDARAQYQPYNLDNLPKLQERYGVHYDFSNRAEPGEVLTYNHAKLHFQRWYNPVTGFRWAQAGDAEIHFLSAGRERFRGGARLELGVRGQQDVEIWLNNMLLFSGTLPQGRHSLELPFEQRLLNTDTHNVLSFWFSDPQPGSARDSRLLAGKFRSLQLH